MAKDTTKASPAPSKDRTAPGKLRKDDRIALYAAARYLGLETEKRLGLRIPFVVYFKDPALAAKLPNEEIDTDFNVPWEPGISDGPTSARFAVVDFDATTNQLEKPARWRADEDAFYSPAGKKLDESQKDTPHFQQVNTWARVQNALDYFEGPWGLGRRISWGFEGNRLIVVPHAGYGKNAYYDRKSKSLQFYYFDADEEGEAGPAKKRIYTCLSGDIVIHEFGHAVLDGIRPYFLEAISPQTAAFHEFMGDLSAILIAFRNNSFRRIFLELTGGKLEGETPLSSIAAQFGQAVKNRPYLRSATNEDATLAKLAGNDEPHDLSEVMTCAMFDIILGIWRLYLAAHPEPEKRKSQLWQIAQRIQVMAVQPLDLLPPVEATFRDYAMAVLRAEQIANPTDPQGYRPMMIDSFIARGILAPEEKEGLMKADTLFKRTPIDVFHDVATFEGSRAAAYRFLDDNRSKLFIPRGADIIVPEVFVANKYTRDGQRQPRQILLQYIWREDVTLTGTRFARYEGQTTSFLCGGTLAFNENGNLLHWARKPGSHSFDEAKPKPGSDWEKEVADGEARLEAYLDTLARRINGGKVGMAFGGSFGLAEKSIPPLTSRTVDGVLRFEVSPHFSIDHEHEREQQGERQWQISS
ncbi:hypothetical protein GCM10007874_65300 [Labrys miyagiensis]|uniref:Serine protease n=1 Tax=Labrys miyagiensis TaxID=346912 RepID=A0ABQ6CV05_9HYPH|nr:serine protease [Labrys miyagiensis]GLS23509.1 hypothetical protein GCM10007874_65300 [Labrys miyagiensis]